VRATDPVRAARALGGAAAAVLALEGIAVLFVPRGIAQTEEGLGAVRLTILLVLAVLLIAAAGLLALGPRSRWSLDERLFGPPASVDLQGASA
jgi:hypothetical protein